MDPALGTIVEVPVGRGVVRFSGTTSFKPGKWVGIELYEQKGKNDGSVEGVSYFNCKKDYGVFVRASQIKATFGSELDNAPGPSTVRDYNSLICQCIELICTLSFSGPHLEPLAHPWGIREHPVWRGQIP